MEEKTSKNDYWTWKKETIQLGEPYFYICKTCDGVGAILKNSNSQYRYPHYKICPKCFGEGKLTWIQHIFGN